MTFVEGSAEDDCELTLLEHLQREREAELLAAQAYPFKTDRCTASLGMPLTQSIYACLTCAGVKGYCYACHIECHTDHEVVELGVRRNFVCDCSDGCRLKRASTTRPLHTNSYNSPHNFQGRFCWCDMDPDEAFGGEESTMFQCLVCEDWFHDKCITDLPMDTDAFIDFVCKDCVGRGAVLTRRHCTECEDNTRSTSNAFLAEGWREGMCGCRICADHLARHDLSFVVNPPDIYEPERDVNAGLSLYDLGVKALASIPPDQAYHGLVGMRQLKVALSARLREIEAEGRAVTVGDVQLFFADFNRDRTVRG